MKFILVLSALFLVSCDSGERSYTVKICVNEQDRMIVSQYINECVEKSRVTLQQNDMEDVIEECTDAMTSNICPIYIVSYKYDCNWIGDCDHSNYVYTKVQ